MVQGVEDDESTLRGGGAIGFPSLPPSGETDKSSIKAREPKQKKTKQREETKPQVSKLCSQPSKYSILVRGGTQDEMPPCPSPPRACVFVSAYSLGLVVLMAPASFQTRAVTFFLHHSQISR